MVVKKPSPNRRKSIAVPNQNRPSIVPKARRRAHSIVPGAALSPLAKARRSLAPRKSILKASVNTLNVDPSIQVVEDGNATGSMDFTQDYTTPVYDNTSRMSLGRRVSFTGRVHVRTFETPHSSSTGSPRYSMAESDMDLTSIIPGTVREFTAPLGQLLRPADQDEAWLALKQVTHSGNNVSEQDEQYEEDAVWSKFETIHSSSTGSPRYSMAESDMDLTSIIPRTTSEHTQAMEFTVPLGQCLRPADQDQAWLTLKQATHSGNNVSEQDEQYEEDAVIISVDQFFSITGIKFMDELNAPRRSIHPSQQPVRQPRNPSEIPLAEYVIAMAIDIPQLVLYSRVSRDLEGWIAKRKIVFAQVEEEAAKVTPELFVEYARADEEGQAELLHQLTLIRTNTRYSAKSDWYDWKLQWVEGLRVTVEEGFKSLKKDAHALEELNRSADGLIPELEQEYQTLTEELEREQAEVAEIESGDQDYLNELKATVSEQNIEIEALKAELSEGKDQLRWLQERTEELDAQKREAKNSIAIAEQILHRKKNSTRSEIFRLKAELEALEELHMFRITKVNADLFEFVYASLFHVSIPCKKFIPTVSHTSITRFGKASTRYKDDFPKLSAFLLKAAQWLVSEGNLKTIREIIHCLADYWSSCAQLRSQLTLLSIKYPMEIILHQPSRKNSDPSFEVKTTVLFPSVMGKAFIYFVFSFDTFRRWPMFINTLDCKVDIAYGPLDLSAIMKAVMERLRQANPSDNYACFLDACIEAQNVYL